MIDEIERLLRHNYNFVVVLCGVSLLGAGAGIVGAFAVLRKRALTGDALSHAALPGVCLAFLILGERNLSVMLLGALVSGVIGVAIISALVRWTRVRDDAAIGIVLSVFFGLGIVLLRMIQNMGEVGSKSGLQSFIFGKTTGITGGDVWVIFGAAAVCLAAILVLYKEFRAVSFDADFTRSLGWPVYGIDLLLMSLVAAAVVIGLPTVGVILISALLIMPGAAARFWTERLSTLLVLSGIFGFCTGVVGTTLSATLEHLPAGPIIVLTGTALFLASMLFGVRRGAIARLIQHRQFQREWHLRQFLRTMYELIEAGGFRQLSVSTDTLLARRSWSVSTAARGFQAAVRDGLALASRNGKHGDIELTPAGWREAIEVTRGQRLWEEFLTTYPDQAASVVSLASASLAGQVPDSVVQQLQSQLQAAGRWPAEAAA
jgi:manganese/zinc/iron transport system permease protein